MRLEGLHLQRTQSNRNLLYPFYLCENIDQVRISFPLGVSLRSRANGTFLQFVLPETSTSLKTHV